MRSARFGLLLSILLLNIPVRARQAAAPVTQDQLTAPQQSQPTLPPVTKDAQAVDLVSKSLLAIGGSAAIGTIADYTAIGTMTYYLDLNRNLQGSVRVRGKGLSQFRIDANLPSGIRSESTDGLTTIKTEDGLVQQLHSQSPLDPARLALPYLQLGVALSSRGRNLLYKGIVDVDGHSAHDIQVQHVIASALGQDSDMSAYLAVDFFVDASTFQIVMMQDVIPNHLVRQIRYSDFRLINGVLLPFSISSSMHGQNMWLINLTDINFNSGLQDSDFQL
jgi:hypothetical protein